ncbi:MAG: MBL fold metallo-hydrolase [Acidobacteria bacterium]|nr:MBL fold metallo-hydrolase [Acidobacteriota bacterium]
MRVLPLCLLAVSTAFAAELEIQIIYDNTSAGLPADWGFSALVTFRGEQVLFDTGTRPELFVSNLQKLRIEPEKIPRVVISHEHRDHGGGLYELLKSARIRLVYLLNNFSLEPFRTIEDLRAKVVPVSAARQIVPGIYSTGLIEGSPPEQSLLIETSKGLVVLTGCSHPGIGRILRTAQRQRGKSSVRLLLGGLHMYTWGADQIGEAVQELKKLGVESIVPAHCTGDPAKAALKLAYGSRFDTAGAGKLIHLD